MVSSLIPMIKQLDINNYRIDFIIGDNEEEKHEKVAVIVNISMRFMEDNLSCYSDKLDDTVCYSALTKFLEDKLKNSNFNLIERATQFIYDAISEYINDKNVQKKVELIKANPVCKNLQSASFICSDW
jgi:FolB domain-containing protein